MFYRKVTQLKIVLLLSALQLSCVIYAQTTTIADLGKVGKLRFSLAKTDTLNVVSITQNGYATGMVFIQQNEISEVVQTLNTFIEQTGKKATGQTVVAHRTKDLLLTCSYIKSAGWLIMIQNTDPAFEQNSANTQRKTGYLINYFVEIKPDQLREVVKIFSKLITVKAI